MKLERIIEILEKHQEWRRDQNVPAKTEMQNPIEIGTAIDYALSELKKLRLGVVSFSLRDRFAIAVVTGLTSATNNDGDWTTVDCEETIADMAYRIADECIKRRKQ